MKFIPYGHQSIDNNDINTVKKTLRNELITTGKEVDNFEKIFSKSVGSKYALTCSSGTAALHLCFLSLNIKKNDIVILPIINFIASVNMSYLIGANIFFADVDEITGQMTPDTLIQCIKKNKIKKIKAVVTMYNGGAPNNAKQFLRIKKKYNFFLIEDACHALGGKYSIKENIKVGSCKYSDLTTFSLHPVKSITTGEGGMITTNNLILKNKIMVLRNHGIVRDKLSKKKNNWSYKIVCPGFNYRLSDISCALGASQIKRLSTFIKKRGNIFNYYHEFLKNFSDLLQLQIKNHDQISGNHLFIVIFKTKKLKVSRDEIIQKLFRKKIISQVHYAPINHHPFYKTKIKGTFSGANNYFKNCLSLPIYPDLKIKEVKFVCDCLKDILKKNVKKKNS
tara:strand:- start:858 stop:2039 length:1182 start_codon:yes stop_codon:yes gene_type:complete